ncbi:MAG: hypothetical protein ACTSUV_04105, partial [Candidatus Ranarchaeia archaeon]
MVNIPSIRKNIRRNVFHNSRYSDTPDSFDLDIDGLEKKPKYSLKNIFYAFALIIIILFSSVIVLTQFSLFNASPLPDGESINTLGIGDTNYFSLQISESTNILISINFDPSNDFDLYLIDASDTSGSLTNALKRSEEFFSSGEKILLLQNPLPVGNYYIAVTAFKGSGSYSLFSKYPLKQLTNYSYWDITDTDLLLKGTTGGINTKKDIWPFYLPTGSSLILNNSKIPNGFSLNFIDSFGNLLDLTDNIPANISILNSFDLITIGAWAPTSWVFIEVFSSTSETPYSIPIQLVNNIAQFTELANGTKTGSKMSYFFNYNYSLSIPENSTLKQITDAIPYPGNVSPYFNSRLVNISNMHTGENLSINDFNLIYGKDGLPWLSFTLQNITNSVEIRFTFEITDEYYIWDNYDPNAVLTGIPSDILEIWTRNES